jgi:hypothetical protein
VHCYVLWTWSLTLRKEYELKAGLEVLTAVDLKSSIFWHTAACNPLKVNQSFGCTCRLHLQNLWLRQPRNQHEAGSNQSWRPRWYTRIPPNVSLRSMNYTVLFTRRFNFINLECFGTSCCREYVNRREGIPSEWRTYHNEQLPRLYSSPHFLQRLNRGQCRGQSR